MIKALDGLLFYVNDLTASQQFYEQLGFQVTRKGDICEAMLGDFEITLVDAAKAHFKSEATKEPRGAGVFVYLRVDDIDAWYQILKEKGLTLSSEPNDWPWGNREFVLKDPDGYKLVFYQPLQ